MQLNLTTDYAVRTVVYLAGKTEIVSAGEIGTGIGISEKYLMKVLRILKENHIVEGYQGKHGGYVLAKAPEQITLWEIVSLMEGTMRVNRCLEDDCYCSREAVGSCKVRTYYAKIQKQIEEVFSSATIADILKEEG